MFVRFDEAASALGYVKDARIVDLWLVVFCGPQFFGDGVFCGEFTAALKCFQKRIDEWAIVEVHPLIMQKDALVAGIELNLRFDSKGIVLKAVIDEKAEK